MVLPPGKGNLKQQTKCAQDSKKTWGVLLCLLLVLVFTVAQATHLHEVQGSEAANQCALCLVAHSAVSSFSALPSVAVAPSSIWDFLSPVESEGTPCIKASELYSRPPPSV